MSGQRIKVLIVDDSALVREMLTRFLSSDPEIEVVGTAPDPIIAREKIKQLSPDVLTLDIEMPRMSGLEFLERLMGLRPMPVVMISTLTRDGADATLKALELGAVDYVSKPTSGLSEAFEEYREEIVSKVKAAATAKVRGSFSRRAAPAAPMPEQPTRPAGAGFARKGSVKIIGIGASTGGVDAIGQVLQGMPEDGPGIAIVQHMPAAFTGRFAARLNSSLPLNVKEAEAGDVIKPGMVLIAPGDRHLTVIQSATGELKCELADTAPVSGHRPSVDVFFGSLAKLGAAAVGVILTGMGSDGAAGMKQMFDNGCATFAQDAATCVVYGMPRAAVEAGCVQQEMPITRLSAGIIAQISQQ